MLSPASRPVSNIFSGGKQTKDNDADILTLLLLVPDDLADNDCASR